MLEIASIEGYSSAFSRADSMKPCPIGAGRGLLSRHATWAHAGLVGKNPECRHRDVCGATLPTIVARNLARAVAGGTAAHSDHGSDLAMTLLAARRARPRATRSRMCGS